MENDYCERKASCFPSGVPDVCSMLSRGVRLLSHGLRWFGFADPLSVLRRISDKGV